MACVRGGEAIHHRWNGRSGEGLIYDYLFRMSIDKEPVKGRGAALQVPNRFLKRHYAEEHWEAIDEPMELG